MQKLNIIPVCLLAIAFAAMPFIHLQAADSNAGKFPPWPKPDKEDASSLIKELKKQLPTDQFQVLPVGPWIVATNLSEHGQKNFVDSTIKTYGAAIQRQLFTKKVRTKPLKVYLFKDATSYVTWNKKLFGEKPGTPYGYFSRTKRAMVMNIGTGGGTLLHEMVHAMAEEDFPDIPAWLNEGIGSLFEASSRGRDGVVRGVTNWRLKGLLIDLKNGTAPKFEDLLQMDDTAFYGGARGDNYASARYLMQWIQEQGKLKTFYTNMRDGKFKDGRKCLMALFDNKKTIEALEKECYAWVKKLKGP